MNKYKFLTHSFILILFNWIIFIINKSDTMYFKGSIPVSGLGKNIFSWGLIIFFLYFYINQYYVNEYKSVMTSKRIIIEYILSPLFILWCIMNTLLLYNIFISYYISFNVLLIIYAICCLALLYFQNKLLKKFEMIKKLN